MATRPDAVQRGNQNKAKRYRGARRRHSPAEREKTGELMDKNRIEGRHGAMSWHNTAKSSGLPVEVNAAVVRGSNAFLPGEILRGNPVGSQQRP